MEFTDMPGLGVRPGLLTVWRPVPADPGSPRWAPDARPASYVQEGHITHRRTAAPAGPSWIGTAFDLPGALDPGALRAALAAWTDRHESLRSHLRPHGTGLRRATLPPGAVTFRAAEEGTYASGAALRRRMEAVFDQEADPAAWPSYLCATVSRPASTTLCLAFDHSTVDGYSLALAAYEVRRLYAAARHGIRARLADVGGHPDFAALERRAADRVGDGHRTVLKWREFLRATGGGTPGFPVPVGADGAAGLPQRNGAGRLLDAARTAAFEAACHRAGVSFCAGLLACLALAAGPVGEFAALMPFHTRHDARWTGSVGWYVGVAPLRFAVRAGDGFAPLAARALAALREARPMAEVPLARVAALLGVPVEPRFFVSYMDLRTVPGAPRWADWRATMLRSSHRHPDEVYLWVNRSPHGTYVSYRYPDTGRGRAAVPPYVDAFRSTLAGIGAGAGQAVAA
ncbi:hypothetical protein GCM10010218_37160 [Streptomyces mashuensis]|uniref:Condensation domain-containing protein n=1 Tax=Streptomyces mashuensis TaxID=33904 RepID=A0A919B4F9_9ACTN|nr:condensation domain-containing protein [Streptomyces mashuensis]GHF52289.1 hypothetical protein GCM10010218_37160 [Streptomyces mashuensis]